MHCLGPYVPYHSTFLFWLMNFSEITVMNVSPSLILVNPQSLYQKAKLPDWLRLGLLTRTLAVNCHETGI
jgi:hypothetical protein